MALGRYIAICHPLHARGYIRPRGTRIAVLVILLASCIFNAPRFCHFQTTQIPCHWLLMTKNSTADDLLQLAPPPDCDCFYYAWVTSTPVCHRSNNDIMNLTIRNVIQNHFHVDACALGLALCTYKRLGYENEH